MSLGIAWAVCAPWIACALIALGSLGPWAETAWEVGHSILAWGALICAAVAVILLAPWAGRRLPDRWRRAGVVACGGMAAVLSLYAVLNASEILPHPRYDADPDPTSGAFSTLAGSTLLVLTGLFDVRPSTVPPARLTRRRHAGTLALVVTWLAASAFALGNFTLAVIGFSGCEDADLRYPGPPLVCEGGAAAIVYEILVVTQLLVVIVGGLTVLTSGKPDVRVRRGALLGLVLAGGLALAVATLVLASVRA